MNEEQNTLSTSEEGTLSATKEISKTVLGPWEIVTTACSRTFAQPKLLGWLLLMYVASMVIIVVSFFISWGVILELELLLSGILIRLFGFLIGMILSFGSAGAVLYCIAKEQESFWDGWKLFWPNFWQFALLGCITTLVFATGLVLLVAPFFILLVYMLFTQIVFAKEDVRGIAVLVRSTELVHGAWWRTLGRLIFILLPFLVLAVLFDVLSKVFGEEMQIVWQLVQAVMVVYFIHATYLMYEWRLAETPNAAEHPKWLKWYKIATWFGVPALVIITAVSVMFMQIYALMNAQYHQASERQRELMLQQMEVDVLTEEITDLEVELESEYDGEQFVQ